MREAASDQNHSHASSGNIAGSVEWLMIASLAGRWKKLAGRESWARRKVLLAVVPPCTYSRPGGPQPCLQLRSEVGPAQNRTEEEDQNGNRTIASIPLPRGRRRRRNYPLHPDSTF